MKLKFWGVRGSINSPLDPAEYKEKIKKILDLAVSSGLSDTAEIEKFVSELPVHLSTIYGGNTSCVSVSNGKDLIILDAGTGIRKLGNEIISGKFPGYSPDSYNIFFTHLHLDHINGLPFFAPVHFSGKKINFFAVHDNFEKMLCLQQNSAFFPVSLESRPCEKTFNVISEGEKIVIGDLTVISRSLNHPNGSYSYRIESGTGRSIVYATDAEYTSRSSVAEYLNFFKNADALIFDSQYNFNELAQRYNFGHSTAEVGVDAAVGAEVRKLFLFHHNHESSDEKIASMLVEAKLYKEHKYPDSGLEIFVANEGMEINL
jgi:phosphoribosyl 1,2-cyclic phosphodiesterase